MIVPCIFFLLLLLLTFNRQYAIGEHDRDVLLVDARKLGFDDDCIGVLVDVEVGDRERAFAPEQRGPPQPTILEPVEYAIHLIAHGAEDVPRTSDGLLWRRGDF